MDVRSTCAIGALSGTASSPEAQGSGNAIAVESDIPTKQSPMRASLPKRVVRREPANSEADAKTRDRAASTITRSMRNHIARKEQTTMIASGSLWTGIAADLHKTGRLDADKPLTTERLSSINLSALRRRLGPLSVREAAFFARFTQQKFFATHFTNSMLHHQAGAGMTMSLLSRKKLQERGMSFNSANTTELDMNIKADHGHVFFSLECGDTPKKLKSRFGSALYRVPFDAPIFRQAAWGALDDLLCGEGKPSVEHHFPGMDVAVIGAIKTMAGPEVDRNDNNAAAFPDIFVGKDLIAAAGLSLLAKLRGVDAQLDAGFGSWSRPLGVDPDVAKLLNSRKPEEFNALLTAFHRIEVRVPGHTFSTDFQHYGSDLLKVIEDRDMLLKRPESKLKALVAYSVGSQEEVLRRLHLLQDFGVDVARLKGRNGTSLLHLICMPTSNANGETGLPKQSVLPLVPALLAFGLDVNARDAFGNTPLMWATHDPDLAEILIKHGADVNAQTKRGCTPLFSAHGPGVANLLVRCGADVHHLDNAGRTALHGALQICKLDSAILRLLIAAGVPVDDQARELIVSQLPPQRVGAVPQANAGKDAWLEFFDQEAEARLFDAGMVRVLQS